MGIIIVPLILVMLLFWIPGVWLAIRGILLSERKEISITLLATLILLEITLVFVGPFWVNKSGSIYQWGLLFDLAFRLGGLALTLGLGVWIYSRIKKKPALEIVPASLCVSTGLAPILYFTISDQLAKTFEVSWSY